MDMQDDEKRSKAAVGGRGVAKREAGRGEPASGAAGHRHAIFCPGEEAVLALLFGWKRAGGADAPSVLARLLKKWRSRLA